MRLGFFVCTVLMATAAAADSPVNFAYRDPQGNLVDVHFDGKAWRMQRLNLGGMTAAPAAAGDPSAFAGPPSIPVFSYSLWTLPADHRDFSYVGEHGDILHVFHQWGKWAHETLNNAGITNAPPAVGQVAATAFTRERLTYTFRDRDGNIQHIASREGTWQSYRLNNGGSTCAAPAAGDPAVLEAAEGTLEVVYLDVAGGVQHLRWGPEGWSAERLNLGSATGAPAAAGNPTLNQARGRRLHCAYRDINGDLHHLERVHGKWLHDQMDRARAAGEPAAAVRRDGQLDYVYRDAEGGLHHRFLKDGHWTGARLDSGGPPAARGPWIRPAPYPEGEALEVFYLDGAGNLQHLSRGTWSGVGVDTGAHPPAGGLAFY